MNEQKETTLKYWPGKKTEQPAEGGKVIRAEVFSEAPAADIWEVRNKDPNKRYVWARKDDDREMADLAHKGYVPATGDEEIMGNPFEAKSDKPGATKVRGGRILMCCPKHAYVARQKAQAARQVSATQAARSDARRLMAEHRGATVEAVASNETKNERLEE